MNLLSSLLLLSFNMIFPFTSAAPRAPPEPAVRRPFVHGEPFVPSPDHLPDGSNTLVDTEILRLRSKLNSMRRRWNRNAARRPPPQHGLPLVPPDGIPHVDARRDADGTIKFQLGPSELTLGAEEGGHEDDTMHSGTLYSPLKGTRKEVEIIISRNSVDILYNTLNIMGLDDEYIYPIEGLFYSPKEAQSVVILPRSNHSLESFLDQEQENNPRLYKYKVIWCIAHVLQLVKFLHRNGISQPCLHPGCIFMHNGMPKLYYFKKLTRSPFVKDPGYSAEFGSHGKSPNTPSIYDFYALWKKKKNEMK